MHVHVRCGFLHAYKKKSTYVRSRAHVEITRTLFATHILRLFSENSFHLAPLPQRLMQMEIRENHTKYNAAYVTCDLQQRNGGI